MQTLEIILQKYPTLRILSIENYQSRLAKGEERKKLEGEAIAMALTDMGLTPLWEHHQNGQPYLTQHPTQFLSISHSNDLVAVVVAPHPIGIDVEHAHPRIGEAASQFIQSCEQQFIQSEDDLHLIWSAKEAFYKLMEGRVQHLNEQVVIKSISEDSIVISYLSEEYSFDYCKQPFYFVIGQKKPNHF
jgi:4'-phosphopantetheinyl transferase